MSARPFLGQMRHRLVLEAPVDVPDGAGGVTRSYQPVATLHAQIRTLRAFGRERGGQPQGVVTHQILFRKRADLSADMRLRKGTRVFTLIAIEDFDDLSNFVRAQCEELSP
jgi:SPP1 family predicted phage head-tail adaptor